MAQYPMVLVKATFMPKRHHPAITRNTTVTVRLPGAKTAPPNSAGT
jgi:hypothetical protein